MNQHTEVHDRTSTDQVRDVTLRHCGSFVLWPPSSLRLSSWRSDNRNDVRLGDAFGRRGSARLDRSSPQELPAA